MIAIFILYLQFMQKNVSKRLGCVTAHGGEEAIKHHSFFRDMKWKDLEDRKIKPPFRPKIVSCFMISILYIVHCYKTLKKSEANKSDN